MTVGTIGLSKEEQLVIIQALKSVIKAAEVKDFKANSVEFKDKEMFFDGTVPAQIILAKE